jgi:hypothetical protein
MQCCRPAHHSRPAEELRDAGRLTGEPRLDDVLDRMRTAKHRASLQTWISRIAHTPKLRDRVAGRLRDRGVLRGDGTVDARNLHLTSRERKARKRRIEEIVNGNVVDSGVAGGDGEVAAQLSRRFERAASACLVATQTSRPIVVLPGGPVLRRYRNCSGHSVAG